MSTLSVKHLTKSYRARQVVKDVSLDLSAGEVVGLLGPNGAGKTTSFRMVVGLIAVENGTIKLNGTDITRLATEERARLGLGYLPQDASVFRKLTVEENLLAVLEVRRELDEMERQRLAEGLMREFHITHVRDTLGGSLSGGERRRIEIARALASEPEFILLDEPFAGVDPISVADIKQIINHLKDRGIGVLITDHNVKETLGICDRAYIVSDGRIIASGSTDEILDNEQVRKVYLGDDFTI
ncbi:MAG: LPS export ABC transporter ATP-binding protein [Gammaproteobacteria bacterium]